MLFGISVGDFLLFYINNSFRMFRGSMSSNEKFG
jgi:hypothetical protein